MACLYHVSDWDDATKWTQLSPTQPPASLSPIQCEGFAGCLYAVIMAARQTARFDGPYMISTTSGFSKTQLRQRQQPDRGLGLHSLNVFSTAGFCQYFVRARTQAFGRSVSAPPLRRMMALRSPGGQRGGLGAESCC